MFYELFLQELLWTRREALIGAAALVLFGLFYFQRQHDLHAHYEVAPATVATIEESCYLKRHSAFTRPSETSDRLGCDQAERDAARNPEWIGARIEREITISYEYVSPADRRKHAGSVFVNSYPDGRKLHPGDAFSIMASRTVPDDSTAGWQMGARHMARLQL